MVNHMRLWYWLTGRKIGDPDGDNWDVDNDSIRRELISTMNDGIISAAAIVQGLITGGASWNDAIVGVVALVTIGIVGTGASQYAEAVSERKHMLAVIDSEKQRINENPLSEFEELAAIYQRKGLSKSLSHRVAQELTEQDALKAQLDAEYGIKNIFPRSWAWKFAGMNSMAFLVGSLLPMILLLILPWNTRQEVTIFAVVVALTVSGWIGSYSEHSSPFRAIGRTVLLGLGTLAISTIAGTLVRF